MDREMLDLELQERLESCDMEWIRRLPDAMVLDPRHWPDALMRQHPHPRMHSVIWYAALARESMRRLSRLGHYPGYADDKNGADETNDAMDINTGLLQSA